MKKLITIFLLLVAITSCNKDPTLSLSSHSQKQIIAFLPLDNFNSFELKKISFEISAILDKPVIILESKKLPYSYFNMQIQQYSADSILDMLTAIKDDGLIEIVAITHKPIFTCVKSLKTPTFQERLFGLGDHPGNVCVVSDNRLRVIDSTLSLKRITKCILHELGHNMGLDHCKNFRCIMSEENGNLRILDLNDYYCADCLKKLKE